MDDLNHWIELSVTIPWDAKLQLLPMAIYAALAIPVVYLLSSASKWWMRSVFTE